MGSGYRRALLKISGEALAGNRGHGIDPAKSAWIAAQIASARRDGRELGIVIGGGNILRGVDAASVGVPPLVADRMGMVATVINALAFQSALEKVGERARVMCAFPVGRFVEEFEEGKAREYLAKGHIVIFAGGTGNPCFTTDSAAALRAVEIDAEVMVKCTQVKGIYDKDPKRFPDAVFFERITPREVIERRLGVIDAAAMDILARKLILALVINLHEDENIRRALAGEEIGTTVQETADLGTALERGTDDRRCAK
ncbi:MAG: uridine monophosphate kinase [Thermodesulfobacteriota bacterium]